MSRKLLDGREVEESEKNVDIIIRSKCPKKWRITDMETGQIYEGTGNTELYKQWKLVGRLRVKGVKRELNKKLRNGQFTTKEIIEAMDKIR
jgi:hypothetical protein